MKHTTLPKILSRLVCLLSLVAAASASGAYTISTLAGVGPGTANGTGSAARFDHPYAVTLDGSGNLFVADTYNHTIRKVTSAGVVTTIAGVAGTAGDDNGTGTAATFSSPSGIAVDAAGNLYVSDTGNHLIRKIDTNGLVTTLADGGDGFTSPAGLAVGVISSTTYLFVTDGGTGAVSRIDVDTGVVNVVADGADGLVAPMGVAFVGSPDTLYVADAGTHTVWKIVLSPHAVTTFAGEIGESGTTDDTGTAARFNNLSGITTDGQGNLYIADTFNNTIRKIVIADAEVTTLAGNALAAGSADGTGAAATFNGPGSLVANGTGDIFVADTINNTIRKVTSAGVVTTIAGVSSIGSADGTGEDARFHGLIGVAIDAAGNTYVSDTDNHTIRKVTPAGVVTTIAGLAGVSGSTNDTGTLARFAAPHGLALDSAGNLFVADTNNHVIRKIVLATGAVSTFAGDVNNPGDAEGNGAAGRFVLPTGLAIDDQDNLYVTDSNKHTIRKVTPTRDVTTWAGTSGTPGSIDDTGTAAQFSSPMGIAVDAVRNVYVADTQNQTVRKITPTREVTTLAGIVGGFGYGDDAIGTNALFANPEGIAVDRFGNVLVADSFNHVIRKITPTGSVSTVAGLPGVTGSANGFDTDARFFSPKGIAVDRNGTIFISDWSNNTLRKGTLPVATVALGSLSATYDGTAKAATATTSNPSGLTVNFTYNGSATAPTNAGSYTVVGTIDDANYTGSATDTLVIAKASASVSLTGLTATYDGTPKIISATTTPGSLSVDFTYDGSGTAPTNAGSYTVVGTINNANYQGSSTDTLVISKAAAVVTLGSLSATYDGSPKSASATTNPASLTVNFTYDGSATVPTNAGTYAVVGTISDANYTGTASGSLEISKATATVTLGSLAATYDGNAKTATATTNPASLTVAFMYDGSATAPTNAGSYAVVGTINDANYQGSNSGTLVISKATATVTLGSLSATYNGSPKSATATTNPSGKTVEFTYDGSATAPTNAGSYAVVGTINDANYQGSNSGTLVISKATATVTLGSLSATYNGSPKSATATTNPSGKTVEFTYDGSATAPTNAGSYAVVGTINDINYQGSSSGTLEIAKATATVTLGSLAATYDGSPKAATATTTPGSLTVNFTYDGSATAPTAVGSYAVVGTIADANYQGTNSGTLVISKATATVTLGNLTAVWDGTAKSVTATTNPASLTVAITYDGSSTAPTNPGSYAVVATVNEANYSGTASGTLMISDPGPSITAHSDPRNVIVPGQGATLSVTASGYGAFTYQWTHNGRAISGATSNSLTISNATVRDNGYYLVTVTNAGGSVRSAPYFVTVAPTVTHVVGWGENNVGQTNVPTDLTDAIAVEAAAPAPFGYSLALKRDGTVVAWGTLPAAVPSGLTEVVAIAAGPYHAMALKSDGHVVAWGSSSFGLVSTAATFSDIVSIQVGENYAMALKADGTVVAWGDSSQNRTAVPAGLGSVSAIAASQATSYALKVDGTVVAWGGNNEFNQRIVPDGLSSVTALASRLMHCLAVRADGTVVAWGWNQDGQSNVPAGLTNVVGLGAGALVSFALKSDGTIVSWGTEPWIAPMKTVPIGLTDVFTFSSGTHHVLALCSGPLLAPTITTQPVSVNVVPGAPSASFTVAVTGAPLSSCNWERQASGVGSWTLVGSGLTYSIANPTVAMSGDKFRCVVTNTVGSVTSNEVTLTVANASGAPVITSQPQPMSVPGGETSVFSVTATGNGLSYQWQRSIPDGTETWTNLVNVGIGGYQEYDGITGPTLTLVYTLPSLSGSRFRCVVSNTAGQVASDGVTLTVLQVFPPMITLQPRGRVVAVGGAFVVTANATGTPTPTYQWKKNGVNIPGATSASYTIPSVQLGDAGSYTMVATNSAGSASSNAAVLTVGTPVAGDFDLDGVVDASWQNPAAGQRSMWLMDGSNYADGGNVAAIDFNWRMVASADFNGDGKADIFWQNAATGQRYLWLMNGTTHIGDADLGVMDTLWTIVAAADFNGDGKADILWQNTFTGQRVIWFMNGTTHVYDADLGVVDTLWTIAGAGDFNGDGKADILWQNTYTGQRVIWFMDGATHLSDADLGIVENLWSIAAAADFNSDGKADIVWQNTFTGQRYVWYMNGGTSIGSVSLGVVDTVWSIATAADFNGDGKADILWQLSDAKASDFNKDGQADILWQSNATGERVLWFMQGINHAGGVSLASIDLSWSMAATADFNNDGQTDIFWQNTVTGQRLVWLMHGTTHVSDVSLGSIPPSWSIVAAADFTGDKQADILWQNTATGQRVIWVMDHGVHVYDVDLGYTDTSWSIVGAADFNSDGQIDIVWQNTTTGQRIVWVMARTIHAYDVILTSVNTNWSIAAVADYNGDKQPDLVWQNLSTGERRLWLMAGTTKIEDIDLGAVDSSWSIVR